MAEFNCYVDAHFENLDKYPEINNDVYKDALKSLFLHGRDACCVIFNDKIGSINAEWDETGKPCSFGSYAEDINPEYSNFIRDRFEEDFKMFNERFDEEYPGTLEFYLDEMCDIRARLKLLQDVSIWITIRPV